MLLCLILYCGTEHTVGTQYMHLGGLSCLLGGAALVLGVRVEWLSGRET